MTIQEIIDYLDSIPHETFSFTIQDNFITIFFAPSNKTRIKLPGFDVFEVNNIYKIKGELEQ